MLIVAIIVSITAFQSADAQTSQVQENQNSSPDVSLSSSTGIDPNIEAILSSSTGSGSGIGTILSSSTSIFGGPMGPESRAEYLTKYPDFSKKIDSRVLDILSDNDPSSFAKKKKEMFRGDKLLAIV